jgi:hypothetical protein
MQARPFLLGFLSGVFCALLVVATVVLIIATRPSAPRLTQPPGAESDITVRVSENYLSQVATAAAHEREESIGEVTVDVQPDNRMDIALAVKLTILGKEIGVNVGVVGSVRADEEGLRFSMDKVQLVGIGIPAELLPASLQAAIQDLQADVNRQVNDQLLGTGLAPVGVATDSSGVTISLRAK